MPFRVPIARRHPARLHRGGGEGTDVWVYDVGRGTPRSLRSPIVSGNWRGRRTRSISCSATPQRCGGFGPTGRASRNNSWICRPGCHPAMVFYARWTAGVYAIAPGMPDPHTAGGPERPRSGPSPAKTSPCWLNLKRGSGPGVFARWKVPSHPDRPNRAPRKCSCAPFRGLAANGGSQPRAASSRLGRVRRVRCCFWATTIAHGGRKYSTNGDRFEPAARPWSPTQIRRPVTARTSTSRRTANAHHFPRPAAEQVEELAARDVSAELLRRSAAADPLTTSN